MFPGFQTKLSFHDLQLWLSLPENSTSNGIFFRLSQFSWAVNHLLCCCGVQDADNNLTPLPAAHWVHSSPCSYWLQMGLRDLSDARLFWYHNAWLYLCLEGQQYLSSSKNLRNMQLWQTALKPRVDNWYLLKYRIASQRGYVHCMLNACVEKGSNIVLS